MFVRTLYEYEVYQKFVKFQLNNAIIANKLKSDTIYKVALQVNRPSSKVCSQKYYFNYQKLVNSLIFSK